MGKKSKKYYAVSQMDGQLVNKIFTNWVECQSYLRGHKGLKHKGFFSEKQAQDYLNIQEQNFKKENIIISSVSTNRKQLDCSFPLTNDQKFALSLLKEGHNIFLTGNAGTGKSYTLQCFLNWLNSQNKEVLVCATTGVAAINIDGITVHKAFNAPTEIINPQTKVRPPSSIVINADVIIIDEISMCRIDLFEYVIKSIMLAEQLAQENGNTTAKQIVLVGDFFQLPPVIASTNGEKKLLANYYPTLNSFFAFLSPLWKEKDFKTVCLNQVVRQEDKEFVNALNQIRLGNVSSIDYFNTHCSIHELHEGIKLFGKKDKVEEMNNRALADIPENEKEYHAIIKGDSSGFSFPTEKILHLKKNCRVMSLINDSSNRYQNGSLGSVIEMTDKTINILLDTGKSVEIEQYTWSIKGLREIKDSGGRKTQKLVEIGTFTQFPLRLAYAITIHKSQGQTYDKVNINPSTWDSGQLYVALSRVKKIENLYLYNPIEPKNIVVSEDVKQFYEHECTV